MGVGVGVGVWVCLHVCVCVCVCVCVRVSNCQINQLLDKPGGRGLYHCCSLCPIFKGLLVRGGCQLNHRIIACMVRAFLYKTVQFMGVDQLTD